MLTLPQRLVNLAMEQREGGDAMTTVDKALSLLEHFSEERPEIGLSEFSRLSGYDKSAALRLLSALGRGGFVQQDPTTRRYRLGAAFLRYARLRESTFPVTDILRPIAERLRALTNETVHISLLNGDRLSTIIVIESSHANRVHITNGMMLPLNATASGFCCLAFSDDATVQAWLAQPLETFSPKTLTDPRAIMARLPRMRAQGYAMSDRAFDSDVTSVAAPIFDAQGKVFGAISIAIPASRSSAQDERAKADLAIKFALEATRALFSNVPGWYLDIINPKHAAA